MRKITDFKDKDWSEKVKQMTFSQFKVMCNGWKTIAKPTDKELAKVFEKITGKKVELKKIRNNE